MSSASIVRVTSRDNALLKDIRRLVSDPMAYRRLGKVWIEGDHLCRAALAQGRRPAVAVFAESHWAALESSWHDAGPRIVIVDDRLLAAAGGLESAAPMGFILDVEETAQQLLEGRPTIVLDRLQDAGNVGTILRSAAAFGFEQVVALKGTAGLWSPKTLRAGMGAHFALRLVEAADASTLDSLRLPLLATSSHEGEPLHRARLPWPCAWLFGHEGQGAAPALLARADRRIRIAQPGGEESLNVAAAAAICLHASAVGAIEDMRGPL